MSEKTAKMNVFIQKVAEITPYARNPRKNEKAIDKLAAIIKEFGFKVPVVLDSDNVIVCGHTRIEAAKKLGITEVPALVADDLTPAQIKAFRIADNKIAEYADWDNDFLALEIEELQEAEFDLDLTAFDEDEISGVLDAVNVEEIELPNLANGDKPPFQQKTFTLHDKQVETIEDAINIALLLPGIDTGLNENKNGNALTFICNKFLKNQK